MPFRTAVVLLIAFLQSAAFAQTRPNFAENWQISVLTFGPGPIIYERYGHCAIRLRNDAAGIDVCYDWGNFDFGAPDFLARFIRSDLRYWMEQKPTDWVIQTYSEQDRSITEQTLDLAPSQVSRLIDRIRAQDDDEHRYYPYDYFRDNCATRVRDVIDEVTDGEVKRSLQTSVPATLRWHNRRVSAVGATDSVLCVLMDFAGGPSIDAPMTRWDEMFVPTALADGLDAVKSNGRPLVTARRTIYIAQSRTNQEPTEPPPIVAWMLAIGLAGAALVFLAALFAPIAFRLLASSWSLFAGVGGLFLIGMWGFTGHWAAAWNQNVLQFSPLSFIVIVAVWRRRPMLSAAAIVLGLSVAGAAVTISHLTRQQNAPAVLLALPLHVAVYAGMRRLALREVPREVPSVDLEESGKVAV